MDLEAHSLDLVAHIHFEEDNHLVHLGIALDIDFEDMAVVHMTVWVWLVLLKHQMLGGKLAVGTQVHLLHWKEYSAVLEAHYQKQVGVVAANKLIKHSCYDKHILFHYF